MKAIDRFSPAKAAGLAVALAVANPKNLVRDDGLTSDENRTMARAARVKRFLSVLHQMW
ncbi:hypothetical protein [Streptomyces sp. TLI_105]|uniref:hypothetical protein n=1 Tax=Streptomyces sp. TLI_105 TaxID=1881019 RepID=UPI0008960899|nr:hypothetical protein [Streptomyces sp. TLI_105]SEB81829.1 hypothetical protein SAMN05428939_0800 [Streptomyces sp. TLI_105]